MQLYKANGELWNPYLEDTRELDDLLRRIVDAIRYRRQTLDAADPYGKALARLTEAATEYTATLRKTPEAAGPVPRLNRWGKLAS
jgi:hypothetical protein